MPWALGLRARGEALLEKGEHAEGAYLEFLRQLTQSRVTVDLARTHLLYGQWLRRAKRRRDARKELRAAQDMFAAMGADRFAEQAATELRATGERARARTPATVFDLTPQEARVAGLAAGGASNHEIAVDLDDRRDAGADAHPQIRRFGEIPHGPRREVRLRHGRSLSTRLSGA